MKLSIGLLLAILVSVGCSKPVAEDPDLKSPTEASKSNPKANLVSWPTDVKIHRNQKGEVICPIMGSVIKSPEKSVGYEDFDGVRYYFCCDMCPAKFKENPRLYAKKSKSTSQVPQ